jgi:hypothetical protein
METTASIDVPTTLMVALALASVLAAFVLAGRFARTVGGELGAAFKWVRIGVGVFALTRIDDLLKVTGLFARMHIDYARVVWLPHSLAVLVAWCLITWGFVRMAKAFEV